MILFHEYYRTHYVFYRNVDRKYVVQIQQGYGNSGKTFYTLSRVDAPNDVGYVSHSGYGSPETGGKGWSQ